MENVSPKINIYQQRDFGAKITAVFEFIRENWKPLLKYIVAFTLPVSIVQSFCMNMYMQSNVFVALETVDTSTGTLMATGVYYGLTLICSMVGALVAYSLFYAMLAAYDRREERLRGITWKELSPDFFRFLRRGFVLMLFLCVILIGYCVVTAMLTFIVSFFWIPALVFMLACCVPLVVVYPAYLLDDSGRSLWDTFTWSMRQGFRFWGSTFLVMLVCYLLTSIVSGICAVPWYGIYIARLIVGVSAGGGAILDNSVLLNVLQFLLGVIMLCGTYVSSIVVMLGMTYQYGHIREKVDAVTVDKDINNFDQL